MVLNPKNPPFLGDFYLFASITWPVIFASSVFNEISAAFFALSRVSGGSYPNALNRIGVAVLSGFITLTRTPVSYNSSANAWVKLTTAAFDEEYVEYNARPRVYDDDVKNNSPPLDFNRYGIDALATFILPV